MDDKIFDLLLSAKNVVEIDDIYAPFKPKRVTKSDKAKDEGMGDLAEKLWSDSNGYKDMHMMRDMMNVIKGNESLGEDDVIDGIISILTERISHDVEFKLNMRRKYERSAILSSMKKKTFEGKKSKYTTYYSYTKNVNNVEQHEYLAINRGENENVLTVKITVPDDIKEYPNYYFNKRIPRTTDFNQKIIEIFNKSMKEGYKRIHLSLCRELRTHLKAVSETRGAKVFAKNLKSLLLIPPVRGKRVMGLDPGFRHGCKLAFVNEIGKVLGFDVVYPFASSKKKYYRDWVKDLLVKFKIDVIAIGNGTASRESEIWVSDLIKDHHALLKIRYCIVSESGASVYSCSPIAEIELGDLDVTYRGAVSIARRLQDPLAELVKIKPDSIGVGMYQHDIPNTLLLNNCIDVIKDVVNSVGVDLNTASVSLLKNVSGITENKAAKIEIERSKIKKFTDIKQLKQIKGLGDKTFQLCSGFLRIYSGSNFLDQTGIHPESYTSAMLFLKHILKEIDIDIDLINSNKKTLNSLSTRKITEISEEINVPVVLLKDIIDEICKIGEDIRDELPGIQFRESFLSVSDIRVGSQMKGSINNIVDFGIFIDIGIGKDALLPKSKITGDLYNDYGVGNILKVRIDSLDLKAGKISVSETLPTKRRRDSHTGRRNQKKKKRDL